MFCFFLHTRKVVTHFLLQAFWHQLFVPLFPSRDTYFSGYVVEICCRFYVWFHTYIFQNVVVVSLSQDFLLPKSGRKGHNILVSRVFILYLKFRALAGEGTRFIDKVPLLLPPDFSFQGWFIYTRCPFDSPGNLPISTDAAPESRPQGVVSEFMTTQQYISNADCR